MNPSEIRLWSQDQIPPSSYKIQIGYIEIPKTIKFDEKWLDTPYRFKSFPDATQEADRLFEGYSYRIVGSNDQPYWDAPSYLHQNISSNDLPNDRRWYDIVGIEAIKDNPYANFAPTGKKPQLSPEQQYAMSQLAKLKTPIEVQSHLQSQAQKSEKPEKGPQKSEKKQQKTEKK